MSWASAIRSRLSRVPESESEHRRDDEPVPSYRAKPNFTSNRRKGKLGGADFRARLREAAGRRSANENAVEVCSSDDDEQALVPAEQSVLEQDDQEGSANLQSRR